MPNPTLPGAMTEAEIAEARELLTDVELRGKWFARGCYIYRTNDPRDHRQVARVPTVESSNGRQHPIATFIAVSRTLVPRLLDEVERLGAAHDWEERIATDTLEERDARIKQIDDIADALGDEGEWSNLHDRGDAALELARDAVAEVERLRTEVERMRPVYEAAKIVRARLPASAIELLDRVFRPAIVDLVDAVERAIATDFDAAFTQGTP